MTALTQAQRDGRRREKAVKNQEEDIRLKVRPGTKRALADLMDWADLEESGEAMTLMIHHLHALGPERAVLFLTPPRHEILLSVNVARRLEEARQKLEHQSLNDD